MMQFFRHHWKLTGVLVLVGLPLFFTFAVILAYLSEAQDIQTNRQYVSQALDPSIHESQQRAAQHLRQ